MPVQLVELDHRRVPVARVAGGQQHRLAPLHLLDVGHRLGLEAHGLGAVVALPKVDGAHAGQLRTVRAVAVRGAGRGVSVGVHGRGTVPHHPAGAIEAPQRRAGGRPVVPGVPRRRHRRLGIVDLLFCLGILSGEQRYGLPVGAAVVHGARWGQHRAGDCGRDGGESRDRGPAAGGAIAGGRFPGGRRAREVLLRRRWGRVGGRVKGSRASSARPERGDLHQVPLATQYRGSSMAMGRMERRFLVNFTAGMS
ncbi:hypothetical protein DFJ74DRAFT_647849 [Hyaloraphidium curvatum]|nr:hypothetical protein DFJ74DRAFT_647849 [Hyaloraphidium curvatum]